MKIKICAVIVGLVAVFAVTSQPVVTWGTAGHRIVARIAHEHLRPSVHKTVRHLLDGRTMAAVATWPDEVRKERPETANWHFLDIPVSSGEYVPKRDCPETPRGDCVIEALKRERAALADQSKPKPRRAEALRFIIHFLGDLHQPMHCADKDDRGGNDLIVTFFGEPSNLHSFWDSGLIGRSGLTDAEFAEELLHNIEDGDIDDIQAGDPLAWALEAHKVAVDHAYALVPNNKKLGPIYQDQTWELVDLQLTRAGLRLAKILNDTLKSGT